MVTAAMSQAKVQPSVSSYTQKPDDPEAYYFIPEDHGIKADGKTDVTKQLQDAIFQVKMEKNFGILFIPSGTYRLTATIQIPASIRVIGYGATRPVFYLAPNEPAFQEQNYMVWFTGGIPSSGENAQDANPGTFYSAISNIDFKIAKGNPGAIGIRSHFAQHCFLSHIDFLLESGISGVWDAGNEVEDLRFFGGEYGLVSGRSSPGWPIMMVDTYFEGQSKAAVYSKEAGLDIVGMHVRNVPVAFEMQENLQDRLNIEKCLFENISDAAIKVGLEDNTFSQLNARDIDCRNVSVFVSYTQSGRKVNGAAKLYHIEDFAYGLVYRDLASKGNFEEICKMTPVTSVPKTLAKNLPQLPAMTKWVNVREYGAKGDGEADDTEAFEKAISENEVVYVPQGWYRLTRTLKLNRNTKLIGLHTFGTQFILKESEPAFSGFGGPVPMVETYPGGDNMINGIGINAGAYNYRAVGLKWQSSEASYLNDVKFVGCHGTLRKPGKTSMERPYRRQVQQISSPDSPVYNRGQDQAWDTQYWSLWVTNGGGGTIKDIWSADTYAAAGIYFSNSSTPCHVYCMSLEHHVRTEARLDNISNFSFHALQFEEEGSEGPDDINLEMSRCRDVEFSNVWMYRVIRVKTPKEIGFRVWDCRNITIRNLHNYTQVIPVIEFPVYDVNKKLALPSWDLARLTLTGDEPAENQTQQSFVPQRLATGFELASGATSDSKGNVYFCENRLRKIYRIDAATGNITLFADFPWKPFALACDTQDNLLVIARYDPQPGYMVNGVQEKATVLPDDNPMYSGWGNGGWEVKAYSISHDNQDSFTVLPLVKSSSIQNARRIIHPSSRWRSDFMSVATSMAEYSFAATDGKTYIPQTFDLFRCSAMFAVTPGQTEPVYVANEMNKTTVAFKVNSDGSLCDGKVLCPYSQYCDITDSKGNIFIADGEIIMLNSNGTETRRIRMEERPISMALNKTEDILYVTTSKSLYQIHL